jgi:hypothetical protein
MNHTVQAFADFFPKAPLKGSLKKCQNSARLRRALRARVLNNNNLRPRRQGSPAYGGICLWHDQPCKNDFFGDPIKNSLTKNGFWFKLEMKEKVWFVCPANYFPLLSKTKKLMK